MNANNFDLQVDEFPKLYITALSSLKQYQCVWVCYQSNSESEYIFLKKCSRNINKDKGFISPQSESANISRKHKLKEKKQWVA